MNLNTVTIGALATAPAPAGIAVVRVSGPETKAVLRGIFESKKDPISDPRRLTYGYLIDNDTKEKIDTCLAVYMPGPNSFTGEDIAEFQFHGGPLLVEKVLKSLFSFGVVSAEPGEFTKRAFLNGKLDLVQAEAVSELINATSERGLKLASENLSGKLSHALDQIGEPLRDVLSEIEASLDFPDEEISPKTKDEVKRVLLKTEDMLDEYIGSYSHGHVVREGFRVLLCGRTNVGKSSLLNAMLKRPRAIVTPISGTTRDVIEESCVYEGYTFVFCDSAGIRPTQDEAEKIGVNLALDRLTWADVVWFVVDATSPEEEWKPLLEEIKRKAKKIWMVVNKIDLNPKAIGTIVCDSRTCAQNFYISAERGDGCQSLVDALVEEVGSTLQDSAVVVTQERHRVALIRALESIRSASLGMKEFLPMEIVSGEIRLALTALEEIVGKTYTEDILGRIFSKFCVGK